MGVFEDVVINARSAAENVGKKAGRLVDISKLRLSAAELNGEISKKYEALGRVVYNTIKNENDGDAADKEKLAHEYVENIDILYQRLDEVNEKINALQNKTVCPSCGASNQEDAQFCSRCGVRLHDIGEAASTDNTDVTEETVDPGTVVDGTTAE